MSLHERLAKTAKPGNGDASPAESRRVVLDHLNQRIHRALVEQLGPDLYNQKTSPDELRDKVRRKLLELIGGEQTALGSMEKARLIEEITHDVMGYGPLEQFLDDPEVTEVMVNDSNTIYVERAGKIHAIGFPPA